MHSICETVIDKPQAPLAALLADPTKNKHWMKDLKNYEPISGMPGTVGAKSRLVFKNGKQQMVFTATMTTKNLPTTTTIVLESKMVQVTAVSRFIKLSDSQTRYVSDQQFQFKGAVNKLLGFFVQGAIKKQQHKHMEDFKHFAESTLT